ncbi:ATP-binding protein [Massilia sp. CF038]|uniref:hybrid sensor histidine kinase/response regulator n=1 Tax=Massilia sp. CF038 TaxID=1881045 RepID=UPI000910100A|nr:ATP-binding protein [Massilia sp. CF038]SHG97602.1 His Kinase A (phospho-acceptor) domain-containing protein [Massilia sp. CF038]
MRLRSHYLLLAFSIVLPIAVFCGIALRMLQQAQHDSAIGRIEESAGLIAQVIDADIFRAQSVIKVLALSQTLARGDLPAFYDEAKLASAGPGAWIILYDEHGQQLVNTRRPFGEQLPARPDPEAVSSMLASGRGQVSDMRWGIVLKGNFVMVEEPIRMPDGRRYVIAQAFSPEFFAQAFSRRRLPASWRVAVLDRNGIIIARSAREGDFIGKRVRPHTLQVINSATSGVFRHASGDETEVYDAYTRSERAGWSIIVGAPVAEINGAVVQGISFISAGLFIALLAALTLAVFAGRHVVRFVAQASEAAAALGRGTSVRHLRRSAIYELESLNDALRDAGQRLHTEMASRAAAENERNELLVLEQQARARAEQQNTAKDEFLAMLGHELRNPLSAVAGAVDILDRGAQMAPEASTRAREVLRRQTEHLRKMVDDLLEVNRALMGKVTLQTETVDLADIARRGIDALHASARTTGFSLHFEGERALVLADPARLLQVVDNILDNALKYSPGGGRIAVAVHAIDGSAVLTVRDQGQGIPAALLPQVFDMFVQGAQSLARTSGGLGIGLALVRRMVELHDGSVSIDSAGAGLGTCVTVRLPLAEAGAVPATPPASAPAAPPRRRVMLVEDNDDAREMMTMLLDLHGCEVHAASSGQAAIALAPSAQPVLAFIDIGLPGMDGYTVARALKADPATAHIELIALTGYGSEADRQRARDAGFKHHFTKPIRLEDLQTALA